MSDTSEHDDASAVSLEAMSLDVPATVGHPNKRPFSGILTRLDRPSDGPPGGSGKRNVLLTRAAAEAALPTLLGMAIDMSPTLVAHDVSNKIGVITGAEIKDDKAAGDYIEIHGFFYAKDCPAEMKVIDAKKKLLGFSFELTATRHQITADNIYRVDAGVFTGAALLLKSKAAYHTTSLAASQENPMTIEELMAALEEVKKANAAQGEQIAAMQKQHDENPMLKASLECRTAVEPHAAALDAAAAGMKAASIGSHPTSGHAVILTKMAGHLRAQAAMGNVAHAFNEYDIRSAADLAATQQGDTDMDDATKKLISDLAAGQATLSKAVADISASMATMSQDIKANQRQESVAPERKTLPPTITAMLDRFKIEHTGTDGKRVKVNGEALSAAMSTAGIPAEKRMEVLAVIRRDDMGLPN